MARRHDRARGPRGGLVAIREARRRGLSPDPIYTIGIILMVGALVGSRIFYLAEHGGLTDPSRWFSAYGFTFYGGFIAVAIGLAVYVWRTGISVVYLDLVALTLPLGAVWLVLALLSVGRFVEFFVRSDSATLALGLETAQWTSLVLIAVAAAGAWLTLRRGFATGGHPRHRRIFAAGRWRSMRSRS